MQMILIMSIARGFLEHRVRKSLDQPKIAVYVVALYLVSGGGRSPQKSGKESGRGRF